MPPWGLRGQQSALPITGTVLSETLVLNAGGLRNRGPARRHAHQPGEIIDFDLCSGAAAIRKQKLVVANAKTSSMIGLPEGIIISCRHSRCRDKWFVEPDEFGDQPRS